MSNRDVLQNIFAQKLADPSAPATVIGRIEGYPYGLQITAHECLSERLGRFVVVASLENFDEPALNKFASDKLNAHVLSAAMVDVEFLTFEHVLKDVHPCVLIGNDAPQQAQVFGESAPVYLSALVDAYWLKNGTQEECLNPSSPGTRNYFNRLLALWQLKKHKTVEQLKHSQVSYVGEADGASRFALQPTRVDGPVLAVDVDLPAWRFSRMLGVGELWGSLERPFKDYEWRGVDDLEVAQQTMLVEFARRYSVLKDETLGLV